MLAAVIGAYTASAENVKVKGGTYVGTVSISLGGDPMDVPNQSVNIAATGVGTCDFSLKNFSLDGDPANSIGDIFVPGVITTQTPGTSETYYLGAAEDLSLAEGQIIADVTLEGTENAARELNMNIHVKWIMDPSDKENSAIPIEVTFTGKWDGTSGIVNVTSDNNQPASYYTIDGKQVKDASTSGMYIVRRGNETEKIVVK